MPSADDRTFVGVPYDEVITTATVTFEVNVTRYAGPTNSIDSTLLEATRLVEKDLASRYAELEITSFGTDCSSSGACRHHDLVHFNGTRVDELYTGPNLFPYLTGTDCSWVKSTFKIPLHDIKFPIARGTNGAAPLSMPNTIRIDFDSSHPRECVKVAGAVLRLKLMSPVILIHGNSSNGAFFARRGFARELANRALMYDYSLNLVPNLGSVLREVNANTLKSELPRIVSSFGADSIHLVAHSKGGLDIREYLQQFYPSEDSFRILTLTTLSTPHNGSVLADIQEARFNAMERGAESIAMNGLPDFIGPFSAFGGHTDGNLDLTTGVCTAFNSGNIQKLRSLGIYRYHTVGADADESSNGRLDPSLFDNTDEVSEFVAEGTWFQRSLGGAVNLTKLAQPLDPVYQAVRKFSTVRLEVGMGFITEIDDLGVSYSRAAMRAWISGVPTATTNYNDIFVAYQSAAGLGSFDSLVQQKHRRTLVGWNGRNHGSIANEGVAALVVPWIILAERQAGDLR